MASHRRGRLGPATVILGLAGLPFALAALVRRSGRGGFHGDVALVTGASRGLGFLIARELGRAGCRLVVCARDADELAHAAADLRRDAEVLALPCDVADRAQVERLVATAVARYGRVDLLVNNAGEIAVGPLSAMDEADFARAFDVMLWGTIHPTLAVLPQMRARGGGRIVNVTSVGGKVSVPHLLPYGTAKFAAVGFSEGLRAEVAGDGVRVVTVVPGLMRTGSHLNARFKGRPEGEFSWFALGATLPFVSMDAERAARRIVAAARRGEAEIVLTAPAKAAVAFHGLFPGLTSDLLGLVNRFVLPASDGTRRAERGERVRRRLRSRLLDAATALGLAAARRYHQHPERAARA